MADWRTDPAARAELAAAAEDASLYGRSVVLWGPGGPRRVPPEEWLCESREADLADPAGTPHVESPRVLFRDMK